MTTATTPARTTDGIFVTTPPAILASGRVLLAARNASIASIGKLANDEITYVESQRIDAERFTAEQDFEKVVGDHQGKSLLSGLYRVDGWLVGFRKINKRGLSLVVYPTAETKKGVRS